MFVKYLNTKIEISTFSICFWHKIALKEFYTSNIYNVKILFLHLLFIHYHSNLTLDFKPNLIDLMVTFLFHRHKHLCSIYAFHSEEQNNNRTTTIIIQQKEKKSIILFQLINQGECVRFLYLLLLRLSVYCIYASFVVFCYLALLSVFVYLIDKHWSKRANQLPKHLNNNGNNDCVENCKKNVDEDKESYNKRRTNGISK